MKKGKAAGPDELSVEVWKCMGEVEIKFFTRLFNRLLMGERMPEEWRRSVLIPIYKNKGDAQCCGNNRGIKLMSHTMKIWKRIESRLRDRVEISKQQYGLMPAKETTDAMFALRMLMKKYREVQRELTLCIRGPRESLRQGSAGRAVVLYEKIRNSGKICTASTGYVRGKQNSSEVCSKNCRKF